jgi:hypothetical protein
MFDFQQQSLGTAYTATVALLAVAGVFPYLRSRFDPQSARSQGLLLVLQPKVRLLASGTVLVEEGTILPAPLLLESVSVATGWACVADNLKNHELAKNLARMGWTFVYMAGSITATAFGFERKKMLNTALGRLIANVKLQRCNCLQIDDVVMHSFLGMPFVSVSAHVRHIQKDSGRQRDEQKVAIHSSAIEAESN